MRNFNPNAKIARSRGLDLPIMTCYLAGRIAGNCIDKCLEWRHKIINHYKSYEYDEEIQDYVSYPISFLDALNSKEADSIDEKGLKSAIPPNLIFDKDLLSIHNSDVIVANMDDFFEEGIEHLLPSRKTHIYEPKNVDYREAFLILQRKIVNRRENFGTIEEVGIAKYLKKPVILIVPEHRKEIFENHPFQKRASVIVTSVDELLEKKWLEILYKSIASSVY